MLVVLSRVALVPLLHVCRQLVHIQSRFRVVSYSSRHETSLLLFVLFRYIIWTTLKGLDAGVCSKDTFTLPRSQMLLASSGEIKSHKYNRHVKNSAGGVRIVICLLPKQSPWLNAIEPKWVHGKRKVVEPEG